MIERCQVKKEKKHAIALTTNPSFPLAVAGRDERSWKEGRGGDTEKK